MTFSAINKDSKAIVQETKSVTKNSSGIIANGRLAKKIAKGCVSVATGIEKAFKKAIKFFKPEEVSIQTMVEVKEVGSVVMTPFHVASLAKNIVTFHRGSTLELTNQVVDIVEDTKEIGDNVVTVVTGLGEAKVIRASRMTWLKPFSIVMTILSIGSVVASVTETIKNVKILKAFKINLKKDTAEGKSAGEKLQTLVNLFKKWEKSDKGYIEEVLGLNAEQFQQGFEAQNIPDSLKLIRHLKGRVKQNIVSAAISGVSSTISGIGSFILIFNPVGMVGAVMLGGTVGLDVGERVHHKIVDYLFVRGKGIKRTKLQWLKS